MNIRDKRPKVQRPCLHCGRSMKTTIDNRICRFCRVALRDSTAGSVPGADLLLPSGRRWVR